MQKLPINFDFNKPEILQKVISANSALAELNLLISTIHDYDLLLQPLTAREAVASSEIENIRTTTLDLLQAEIKQSNEISLEQKETLNYKKAIKLGYQIVENRKVLGVKEIVEIQKQIVPEKWNIRDREVIIANRFGDIVYKPPLHTEIKEYLENFEIYFETKNDLDPLINMAIGHYQFESIHPFLDGNGRTGRILMILYLVLTNKLKYPALFLSGYILEFKAYYYQLFSEVRNQNNWTAWVLFFLNGVELQAKETAQRILEIKNLEIKFIDIFSTELNKKNATMLANYFFSRAFYNQTNMIKELGITRPTATKYLSIMKKLKYFEERKVGREKLYFIPEFLNILS